MVEMTLVHRSHPHTRPRIQSLESSFQFGCWDISPPRTILYPQPKLEGWLKPEGRSGVGRSSG